jgi:hypothetical protein
MWTYNVKLIGPETLNDKAHASDDMGLFAADRFDLLGGFAGGE